MDIRFLLPAEIEMNEASLFYEMRAFNLGKNFLDIIETAVTEIAEQTQLWPEIDKGIRRMLIRRFPYSILYSIQDSEIIIVAVMHQKQKPRYWIDRL